MTLKIGFYPYTYVRTNVMRSLLLKKEDYRKLMKMSVPEITKFLQDGRYKEDIDALGGAYSTTELIERALSRNLDRSFAKLRRISHGNLKVLIDAYLKRYDVYNIKTVLRALKTGHDKEETSHLLSDAGSHGVDFYRRILESSGSVNDALSRMSRSEFVTEEMEGQDLRSVESTLDRNYYDMLLELADQIPSQVNLFKELILLEIETLNLLTLMRLKREGLSIEAIKKLIIFPKMRIRTPLALKIIDKDVEEILETLNEKNGNILEDGIKDFREKESLMVAERTLQRMLLRKSVLMLHQNILSPTVILGFMYAKEIEVRNLRILVKGKKFGLDDEWVERELII